jgi:1,4-alpha-glucan branching enzyme
VILDWVPSHFPSDAHGLAYFDGTHLYEHADSRQGFHPDWKTHIFNYGRNEVRSFLMSTRCSGSTNITSTVCAWTAVASMLYLDYSRKRRRVDSQQVWWTRKPGGHRRSSAASISEVYKNFPDIQTIAEESTSWPMVSRPVYTLAGSASA